MAKTNSMSNKNIDYYREFRFSIIDENGNTLSMIAVPENLLLSMNDSIEELRSTLSEMKTAKDILTMDDVVSLTGLSKSYVYKIVSRREIPYYKSSGGKTTYFKREDVEKWMLATRCSSVDEIESMVAAHSLKKPLSTINRRN